MFVRLRNSAPITEAWQHNGQMALAPLWVKASTIDRPHELILDRNSGRQLVNLGEWLVRDLDGSPLWLTSDDFYRDYEILTGRKTS